MKKESLERLTLIAVVISAIFLIINQFVIASLDGSSSSSISFSGKTGSTLGVGLKSDGTRGVIEYPTISEVPDVDKTGDAVQRSEEHTSELQSQFHLVCRLLLEKKK